MARGGEGVGGGRRFESINITRNGKVINMDGDEMVRQNENDVRCTGGNLITRPLHAPSTRTGEERRSPFPRGRGNRIFYTWQL